MPLEIENFTDSELKTWESLTEKTRNAIVEIVSAMEAKDYWLSFLELGTGRFNNNGDRISELTFWNYENTTVENGDPTDTAITLYI